jgi:hypothetical protein
MANYPQTTTTQFTGSIDLTDGGNVGIGVTNPCSKLQIVAGDILLDQSQRLYLDGTISGNPDTNWSIGKDASHNINVRGASTGSRAFQVCDSANSDAVRLHAEFSGNVGIGTTICNSKLHVIASGGVGIFVQGDTHGAPRGLFDVRGGTTQGAGDGASIWLTAEDGFDSGTNGGSVYLDGGRLGQGTGKYGNILMQSFWGYGNVGIGMTSPTAKLDINPGTISDTNPNIRLRGATSTAPSSGQNGDIQIYENGTTRRLYIKINGSWRYVNLT